MKLKYPTDVAGELPMVLCCSRDQNLRPGARYGPVIRDIYIIECCVSGYGAVIINGREFPIGPGDCYFLLPGDTVTHMADRVEPRCGISCSADGTSIGQLLAKAGISSRQPFAPRALFAQLNGQLEQILQLEDRADPGAELRQVGCLYHILGLLLENCSDVDKNAVIQKAVGIMETRYHTPMTMQQLAQLVGMERSYFSTFFKSRTGLSPHKYLTRLRVQKARMLMQNDSMSVAMVAESVGLDPQNFARIFKRELGVTPQESRQAEK